MRTENKSTIECGTARFTSPGNSRSGDLEVVISYDGGMLLAVVDGLGHGDEAHAAAQAAKTLIGTHAREPIEGLVRRCHEALRPTRGVVMSLAAIDLDRQQMRWMGIGNVQGLLCRAEAATVPAREELLLRAGVVGAQLPSLQAALTGIRKQDTLIFTTDGIRSDYGDRLKVSTDPQSLASHILANHRHGEDDALVLVARIT